MIHCVNCGKEIHKMQEVKNVRALGISLRGECPKCNATIPVGSLWTRKKVTTELILKENQLESKGRIKAKNIQNRVFCKISYLT